MDAKVKESAQPLDLVWGAAAIAAVIGRNERQVFGMLEAGQLPAKKVGGRWVASRKNLQKAFEEDAA